jgi:hypothetical protein
MKKRGNSMPFYEINLGISDDYTSNVIASREEMEELIQAIRQIDCGDTGYCLKEAYFLRSSPEHVYPTAEHALEGIREWITREKDALAVSRASQQLLPEQQAAEREKRRISASSVMDRLHAMRQEEHSADVQSVLAQIDAHRRIPDCDGKEGRAGEEREAQKRE